MGGAYSVGDAVILVADHSDIARPEDLADREVTVGYHSGSHYSAIQALEVFLPPERIKLKLAGLPWAGSTWRLPARLTPLTSGDHSVTCRNSMVSARSPMPLS